MRKLSITLLLISIAFMSIGANVLSTAACKAIIFKRWHEQKKTLLPVPIEATIERTSIQVVFLEDVNEQVTFQVKDLNGEIIFEDYVTSFNQDTYKIDLSGIAPGQYEICYIEKDLALIGEFEIEN